MGDWIEILGDRNAKPDKMQLLASEVVMTADTYIERIDGVLKDAESTPSLLQLKNEVISALTTIKLSTAENLRFQFDVMRRFN